MSTEGWSKIQDLFAGARKLGPRQREEFLAEACREDDSLRAQVEALLAADSAATAEMSLTNQAGGQASATLGPGARLGPYQLEALLGEGGMGQVYRARDTRLGRPVAIKVIRAEGAQRPDFRIRFQREAQATAALNHPHICALYDVGEHEGASYLVMEYVEGQTLASRLREGPLPLDQLLRRAAEVSQALAAAHERGIIHRISKLVDALANVVDFLAGGVGTHGDDHTARGVDREFGGRA
jgi:eukaryotic-like serine/threonine-protein kinase